MLRIQGRASEYSEASPPRHTEGDGLLFLLVLAGSWVIALGVGWVIWRVAPL